MCTHLAKRGATYYFRRAVPDELRPYLDGRREWMVSLRTKDRETAKRAVPALTQSTDKEIDAARVAMAAGARENAPERPATRDSGRAAAIMQARDDAARRAAEWAEQGQGEKEARRAELAPLVEFLRARLKGSTREMPRNLRAFAYLLEEGEFDRTILKEQLSIVKAQMHSLDTGTNTPTVGPTPPPSPAAASVPLLETFDAYAKEQGLASTTAYEWRTNIAALVRFLRHDDAARITVDDLDRWRDALLAETTKRGTPRSPVTVKDKYFAALRSTLNWAVEKRKLRENVATQVVVRTPRKAKLREPDFTTAEAKAILAATMQPAAEGEPAKAAFARRWIPWICAYTGARVNEISQLRGSDVVEIDGIWTLRITPEAGSVKTNEARTVPLHPHLIEQGFPAVAKAAGDAPIFYDPGRVRRPGAGNRHVKKVGERLAAWVRQDVGITDPGLQPNHGWRHTFKTRAVDAGVPERVSDAITGHAAKSVGQTYGRVTLQAMNEAIARMPKFEA